MRNDVAAAIGRIGKNDRVIDMLADRIDATPVADRTYGNGLARELLSQGVAFLLDRIVPAGHRDDLLLQFHQLPVVFKLGGFRS